jgi:tetratricopeptide (TPR) repeat protein
MKSFISALFLVFTVTVAFSQNPTPESFVEKGKEALKANNLKEAEANFQKALDMTKSKNPDILTSVAEAWLTNPQLASRAKPVLEKSISVKPTYKAKILLGDYYLSLGNGGLAISNYEDAAGIEPKNAIPHYKVGVVYLRSTNREAALEAFKKAIEVDPNFALAYKEAAELYYNAKDGANAVAAQEKYLSLITDEKDKEIGNIRLGYYVFMTRDFAKANQIFDLAYSKGILKETSLKYYSLSLAQSGDIAKADKIFTEFMQVSKPGDIDAAEFKTAADFKMKLSGDKHDSVAMLTAVAYMDSSLKRDEKQTALRQQKAETLYKLRKFPEAVKAYEELIAARKDGKPLSKDLFDYGRAAYFSANFKKADSIFVKFQEAQPAMTLGFQWQGRSLAQQDPESEAGLAKPAYEKLIQVGTAAPDKSKKELIEAYSYLGYYYYIKGNIAESKKNWQAVLAIDPNDARANEAIKAITKAQAAPKPKP